MAPHATRAFIALGSNLGDRDRHLAEAARFLRQAPGFRLERLSHVYETAPVGDVPQGQFLNAVAQVSVAHGPRDLLDALLAYEASAGRVRRQRWGPRTIDLDILLFGELEMNEPGLRIPHPELTRRRFVLVPLAELAPDLVVPGTGATVTTLLKRLPDAKDVVRMKPLDG